MYLVLKCGKCESCSVYVENTGNVFEKLANLAERACPVCGEQEHGQWRLMYKSDNFWGEDDE